MILCDSKEKHISEQMAVAPFSSERVAVANFENACITLGELLENKLVKRNYFGVISTIKFKVMELNEGGLSQVEKRAIVDLGQFCKARKVEIIE